MVDRIYSLYAKKMEPKTIAANLSKNVRARKVKVDSWKDADIVQKRGL